MADPNHQPSLQTYVVWHPEMENGKDVSDGAAVAERIYSHLCRDVKEPLARGVGIPVYFRSVPASASEGLPLPIELDRAQRTAVIVLVDPAMVLSLAGWGPYVGDLWARVSASGGRHLLLPVALDASAFNFQPLRGANSLRFYAFGGERELHLLTSLSHELGRFLSSSPREAGAPARPSAPVRLFISHAKRDGTGPALEFKDTLDNMPTRRFFDAVDIAAGYQFDREIEEAVRESVLLVLLSDAYSSRPWCRREVLAAKRLQRPIVVVDMLQKEELRSFPYMGNAPVICWTGDNHPHVVQVALTEALRFEYHRRRMSSLQRVGRLPANLRVLARAPEILDCGDLIGPAPRARTPSPLVVYPDPPLGSEEIQTLTGFCPTATFATPSMSAGGKLTGKTIGISISESEDLARRGFGQTHLRDAMIECARYLLVQGATLAYGGDLRQGGFTEVLFDLVWNYKEPEAAPVERIHSYLAWTIHRAIDLKAEARLLDRAILHRVEPPDDVIQEFDLEADSPIDLSTWQGRYVWARCLTRMRERMSVEEQARLLMGGRVSGYWGKYPGILEEAYVALRSGKPLFLLGAFGGCAAAVIDALQGSVPEALTPEFQEQDTVYAEMVRHYNQRAGQPALGLKPIDYAAVTGFIRTRGVQGLNNGLSPDENQRLFESADLDEILSLVLKGLSHLVQFDTMPR